MSISGTLRAVGREQLSGQYHGKVQVWARLPRSGMSRARAERPGWGRWEQLAWSDLAPAEQAIEASGEPDGRVVASSVIEAVAGDSLWSPSRIRSPPGFDEAAIDGLRQSLVRSPSRSGVIASASRRDERRRSAGDDVVSALVSKLRGGTVKVLSLAVPLLGSRASSGRAWRL